MPFLKSLCLDGLLSFAPGSAPIPLTALNVIVGPNGSGKSNFIEGLELLHATPTGFANAIRDGGSIGEWLWKGSAKLSRARLEAIFEQKPRSLDLRYALCFAAAGRRIEITDELLEDARKKDNQAKDVFFYYRFQSGRPVLNEKVSSGVPKGPRRLTRQSLRPDESVLFQIKDPLLYPELTWVSNKLQGMQFFRDWSFGPGATVRRSQGADDPSNLLLSNGRNLALLLNSLQNSKYWDDFNGMLSRFLPRYDRLTTKIEGGTIQFYLYERGMREPIPGMRLSDGTIRFMALLVLLLSPEPPSMLCLEEPELGLHPDALSILADALVAASKRTQVIVTTHSDILVSELTEQADSVLVCEHLGGTVMKRVDSAELSFWLKKYRLGEIWRIGELGGNL